MQTTKAAGCLEGKGISRHKNLLAFYRQMIQIRSVEEALLDLFAKGLVRGTVHTSLGQEAVAVGVVNALDLDRDVVCSNHRGHGHFLAYCGDVTGLVLEIMGRPEGICGGKGGSQHLHKKNFYSNGILGGMAPVSTGMAFAEKQKQNGAIVTLFIGDGEMAEGAVYEAMNMASLWQLPVLYVLEMNCYAQSTYWEVEHAGVLETRAATFGIPVTEEDGNDVEAVFNQAVRIRSEIGNGGGPQMLFLRTYRMGPHSKGDDLRDPAEIDRHREHEPVQRLRLKLGGDVCKQIDEEEKQKIAHLVTQVQKGRAGEHLSA